MTNLKNINPTKPSFIFGYWRPWNENSNSIDSYLDYTKDVSLAKYGADTVGKYIEHASDEQIIEIRQLGEKIGLGMNVLSNQLGDKIDLKINILSNQLAEISTELSDISSELNFLNRNIDILIEQQKLSNLLLIDICELLRVPNSEKERQHSIELGIKFFINAQKDPDLFDDSLEEFLKAESLMKQDYFVLHRLGLIYMHVLKHLNIQKALEYFTKAAKYAIVDSDPKALELIYVLQGNFNKLNTEISDEINEIQHLAAESLEKAAFAAYVLGQFDLSVANQIKALNYKNSAENYFKLSKYQARTKEIDSCVINLEKSIDIQPSMAIAVFNDVDLMNEPKVLKLLKTKIINIEDKIFNLISKFEKIASEQSENIIIQLKTIKDINYVLKVAIFVKYDALATSLNNDILIAKEQIDSLITLINETEYTVPKKEFDSTIELLKNSKNGTLEQMGMVLKDSNELHNCNRIKIGDKFAGGIVFYLDETGNHGMVAAEKVEHGIWDGVGAIGTSTIIGSGRSNTKLIVEKANSTTEIRDYYGAPTTHLKAAIICVELKLNGYNDWFLPSKDELHELVKQHEKIGGFKEWSDYYHWSSSEMNDRLAWSERYDSPHQDFDFKSEFRAFRPVRNF